MERRIVGARGCDHVELGANAVGELAAENRLGEKVAHSQAHSFGAGVQVVARGDHDDWNLGSGRIFLELAADLKTVHPGHHQVEQDHVNRF